MVLDASALQGQPVDPIYDGLDDNETTAEIYLVDRVSGINLNASVLLAYCGSTCKVDPDATLTAVSLLGYVQRGDN
eukprot:scaffold292726_cov27-Tisochrysis_lutea.AAC.1